MFSKYKGGIKISSVEEVKPRPKTPEYPYEERMDELQRINKMPDHDKRMLALKAFITAEWEILLKLGEPSSQALKSAQASAHRR